MATPQSLVQSNIQDAVGTQSLAQENVPFLANNGNPFTIYNQTPPQGGYLPPVANAYDQWRINPAPPPVNFNYSGGFGGGSPWFNMPAGGGGAGGGWIPPTAPPITTGPTAPPMSDPLPPVSGVSFGGGVNVGNRQTAYSPNPLIGGPQFNIGPGNVPIFGQGGYTGVGGTSLQGLGQGIATLFGGGNQYLQDNSNGMRDWRQIADAALDVVGVTGNFYDPVSKSWDLGRIAASLGQVFTGIPFNQMLNAIADASLKSGGDSKWIPNFIENLAQKYAAKGAEFQANSSENAFDRNMMLRELAMGPSLVSPTAPANPFGLSPQAGWGFGQVSPITGIPIGDAFTTSPFAQNPNQMPTGFGAFNPSLPTYAGPTAAASRGTVGTSGAMAGGPGGYGGTSHYGSGVIAPVYNQATGSFDYSGVQAAAAAMGLGATNFAGGTRFGGAGVLGWAN